MFPALYIYMQYCRKQEDCALFFFLVITINLFVLGYLVYVPKKVKGSSIKPTRKAQPGDDADYPDIIDYYPKGEKMTIKDNEGYRGNVKLLEVTIEKKKNQRDCNFIVRALLLCQLNF